jgi:hypothetical protein
MQVRATQLQDANAQLEVMRAQARKLRLRVSDLQGREQQLRELRFPTPQGPEREKIDQQWLDVRHDATAAALDLEGVNDRISELTRQRDEARIAARATTQVPPPAPEPPPVQAPNLANAGMGMLILFVGPILLVLVYRLFTRRKARDPIDLEATQRLQRMEQTIDSIAIEMERLVEGQRFTTKILAERHSDPAN